MAKFKDLSVDLLYVIFSYLQSDKAQLHSLALSSRLFREVAQRFMVRDASISHSANGSRTELFLRTLRDRPDLVAHVHRLELDLLREDVQWPKEEQNIYQISRLLTNLREFCYLSRDYKVWHCSVPLPLKWGREGIHDWVRRIEWHHNMDPWELHKCMELPRVECIYVKELEDPSLSGRSTSFNVPEHAYKRSTLADLRLGSPDGRAYQALNQLLHLPKSLKRITFESHMEYSPIISPADLVALLTPAKDTLEELLIDIRNKALRLPRQPADFSEFGSLRKLTIPFRYTFGRAAGRPHHAEANFPPSLGELEIVFAPTTRSLSPNSDQRLLVIRENYDALVEWLKDVDGQLVAALRTSRLERVFLHQCDKLSVFPDLLALSVQELVGNWTTQSVGLLDGRLELEYNQCTTGEHWYASQMV